VSGPGVLLTIHEGAGEASIVEVWRSDQPSLLSPTPYRAQDERPASPDRPNSTTVDPQTPGTEPGRGELTDAEQSHEPAVLLAKLVQFQRRLRDRYPELIWERVLERHKSGAVHAHYLISERLEHSEVVKLWRHGHVWLSPKVRTKTGGRDAARVASRYLTKYLVKDPVRDGLGGHRYEVRQGFQHAPIRVWADGLDDARAIAASVMGYREPRYAWSSSGEPAWAGPPASFMSW
jgi:hypothetical protein